jgi:hypothetical protein
VHAQTFFRGVVTATCFSLNLGFARLRTRHLDAQSNFVIRVLTSHSATLIDNIFTNCSSQNTVNGIILKDMSDHLLIYLLFFSSELVQYHIKKKLNPIDIIANKI